MTGRWFYVDGVLTEIRGSEAVVKERVRELQAAHSSVRPVAMDGLRNGQTIGDPFRASSHRRDRRG